MTIHARPRAKINLTLEVGPRRADGYHALRSVFLRLGLADTLVVTPTAAEDSLAIDGLPCPVEGNLVLRAFDLVRGRLGIRLPGLAAQLTKGIPVGAGLGGGSSDGASALDLAAHAWGVGLSSAERLELAMALGSDVPFFSAGVPAALVEGRGEQVTRLPAVAGELGVLLAISSEPLSTAEVFARFDDLGPSHSQGPSADVAESLVAGLDGGQLAAMTQALTDANDLWPAASSLAPNLAARRKELEGLSARPWLMSGSGPTLFTLLPTVAEAVAVGRRLARNQSAVRGGVMLCATDLAHPEPAWRHQWPTEP